MHEPVPERGNGMMLSLSLLRARSARTPLAPQEIEARAQFALERRLSKRGGGPNGDAAAQTPERRQSGATVTRVATTLSSRADVRTEKPVPYMRQLCKHFGHKVDAEFGDADGWIQFEFGRCELQALVDEQVLRMTVTADDDEGRARMQRVVGSHLERFGSRDGLAVSWA